MHKIWILFKREYRAAVRTKSFVISLILLPLLMGGSMIIFTLMKDKEDVTDKKFVIIDHSGLVSEVLEEKAAWRNEHEIFDEESGEKKSPAFLIEIVQPDTVDPMTQRLELSKRVQSGELHAFIEIGPNVLHPSSGPGGYIRYYSEHAFMDNMRYWFRSVINDHLRMIRLSELDLSPEQIPDLFNYMEIEGMGLVTVDKKTGEQKEAERASELQSFLIPYIMVILMFMMVMMSAVPLLSAVMEEKSERIAEVLLGVITPFQFMMGKVLGGIGISLTTATFYVAGGIILAKLTGAGGLIPFDILPWFFVYMVLFIIMVGSGMAALGATCNDNKDAQSLQFPAMLPVILPLFIIMPIIQDPSGSLATTLSFIPPFTPSLMIIRMATPVTIPAWQPVLGLVLVVLFTIFTVWIGARVFRTAILIQGQKPSFANLIRYAFKS